MNSPQNGYHTGTHRLLLVITLAFTRSGVAAAQAPVTRDSAGIQIVENGPRNSAPASWQLAPQPSVDLGGTNAPLEAQFFTSKSEYGLLAALRLRDGRILVADGFEEGSNGQRTVIKTWLKYFSPTGALLSVVKLDDIGEPFGGIGMMCQSTGDTVLIAGATIGVLDGAGRVIRRFPKDMSGGGGFRASACFADGSVLMPVREKGVRLDFSDPNPVLQFIARWSNGLPAHNFGEQPDLSRLPAGPHPSIVANGYSLVVAPARTSELLVYNLANRLVRIIRWADKPAPVTAAEMAANTGRGKASDEIGALPMRTEPYTATWGAYLRVLTDPLGRIWVEDEDHSAPRNAALMSRGWTCFDSTGRMLGRLTLPEAEAGERRYEIQFGRDEVLLFHLNWITKTGAKVSIYPMVAGSKPQL